MAAQNKNMEIRSSLRGAPEMNLTRNHEVAGSIPDLTWWVKDPVLRWLWGRSAAVAPIRPIAWESPYAQSVALKAKRQKNKQKQKHTKHGN